MATKIMECQKASIIHMLSCTDQEHYSHSPTPKHKHPITWKVLVYDKHCQDIMTLLLNVGELRKQGVTLNLTIKQDRQPIPDAPAVYFVEPTHENIAQIAKDCASQKYDKMYIHFVRPISRPLLEEFASTILQLSQANPGNEYIGVTKIYDQFLDFICVEPDMFTLGFENSFVALNDPAKVSEIEAYIDNVAVGVLSAVLTMGVVPIIKCPVGGAAQMVASLVEQKIKNLIHRTKDFNSLLNPGLDKTKAAVSQRPVLILLDRTTDLNVCLQHPWNYRALTHDLLDMKMNRVAIEKPQDDEEEGGEQKPKKVFKAQKQQFDLDVDDEFWEDNAGLPFQDVAKQLENTIQKYTAELQDFNRSTGLNIKDDDLLTGRRPDMGGVNPAALEKLPILTEKKKKIDIHINLAHAILHTIKQRHLDEFYAVEDALRENPSGSNLDKSVLLSCLRDPSKGTIEDKLRLMLIVYLCQCWTAATSGGFGSSAEFVLSKSEFDEIEKELHQFAANASAAPDSTGTITTTNAATTTRTPSSEAESLLGALSYLKSQKSLLIHSMSRQQQTAQAQTQRGGASSLSNWTEKFARHSKILGEQVKLFGISLSSEDKFSQLPVTKIVNAIMNQKPIPETEGFITLDPKAVGTHQQSYQTQQQPAQPPLNPFNNAIVFVVGGGNYIEYQNLKDSVSGDPKKSITYGCTDIVTGHQFLCELAQLGAK